MDVIRGLCAADNDDGKTSLRDLMATFGLLRMQATRLAVLGIGESVLFSSSP
jgi:hypothetical protein